MQNCKRGSVTLWDCKYHLVWPTKYRYQVLAGEACRRSPEALREIAIVNKMRTYAGSFNAAFSRNTKPLALVQD